jgi:vesicle-associated membrane protein 4
VCVFHLYYQKMPITPNSSYSPSGYVQNNPFVPASNLSPFSTPQSTSPGKPQEVKNQVNEVVGIMKNNIDKVVERGDRLENLQYKTGKHTDSFKILNRCSLFLVDNLQQGALQFRKTASSVRRKLWWKNMKLNIMIGVIVVIIMIIAIGT